MTALLHQGGAGGASRTARPGRPGESHRAAHEEVQHALPADQAPVPVQAICIGFWNKQQKYYTEIPNPTKAVAECGSDWWPAARPGRGTPRSGWTGSSRTCSASWWSSPTLAQSTSSHAPSPASSAQQTTTSSQTCAMGGCSSSQCVSRFVLDGWRGIHIYNNFQIDTVCMVLLDIEKYKGHYMNPYLQDQVKYSNVRWNFYQYDILFKMFLNISDGCSAYFQSTSPGNNQTSV